MPESFWTDPLMYQGGSDGFLGPTDDIVGDPAWGIDFEAEVAVITGPVRMGATPEEAARAIRFVMLLNDISLRNLIPAELAKGFGFVQSKPACACSPVAVSVDDLPGWDGARLHGVLKVDLNGEAFGRAEAGEEMTFDFPRLIAHAARTRHLAAGPSWAPARSRTETGRQPGASRGGRGAGVFLHRRAAGGGDDPQWRAAHTFPATRRPGAHLDGGSRRAVDLWRH
jgi:fumarylacetoacetate (FAA) hydrolase